MKPVAKVHHVGSSYGSGPLDTTVIVCKGADTSQLPDGTDIYVLPAGYKIVPVEEPTEAMYGGLARDIVMWLHMNDSRGSALYTHLKRAGREIPAWLYDEIEDSPHTPPKGDVAVAIYRAMVEAA